MKKALIFLFCAGVASFAATAEATQITYDFNGGINGWLNGICSEAAVNANTPGVTFDNTGGSSFTISSPFGTISLINFPYNTIGNSTIATFSSLTDYVSVDMGDYGGDVDNLYLEAYDAANILVDSAYFSSSVSGLNTLSVSTGTASIAWVEFYGVGVNNNSVYWDNFTFNATASVPEPSTMLLLGSGLVGLGLVRRKFRG